MTNRISLSLAAVILGCIALDIIVFSGANLVFLGRHLMAVIEWMAFWR